MSEFHFGCGHGRVKDSKKIARIAREHGAQFIEATMPGDGVRYWFAAPNRGFPFDERIANEVRHALDEAGCCDADGYLLRR